MIKTSERALGAAASDFDQRIGDQVSDLMMRTFFLLAADPSLQGP